HVLRGGPVPVGQAHEDVGVGGADGRGRAVAQVDAAVGQADVVDDAVQLRGGNLPADLRLHEVAELRRLLDARPRAGAEVQLELAGVHEGEEVLPQERD